MKTCLLLVDMQNDYFPGGNMELTGITEAAAKAGILLEQARRSGTRVIHVRHISDRPGATFFVPGTEGAMIHESLRPLDDEIVIEKRYPNSFRETKLFKILTENVLSRLVICGAMSHMCIDATTRAAYDFGFGCTVVEDACATLDLCFGERVVCAADVHASFMAALGSVYASIVSQHEIKLG